MPEDPCGSEDFEPVEVAVVSSESWRLFRDENGDWFAVTDDEEHSHARA